MRHLEKEGLIFGGQVRRDSRRSKYFVQGLNPGPKLAPDSEGRSRPYAILAPGLGHPDWVCGRPLGWLLPGVVFWSYREQPGD